MQALLQSLLVDSQLLQDGCKSAGIVTSISKPVEEPRACHIAHLRGHWLCGSMDPSQGPSREPPGHKPMKLAISDVEMGWG